MLDSVRSFVESIHFVADGPKPCFVKRLHSVERGAWRDSYASNRSLAEDQRHQLQPRCLACREAHLRNDAGRLSRQDRFVHAITAGGVDPDVHTFFVGELEHTLLPIAIGAVVDAITDAECLHVRQVAVSDERGNYAGAMCRGDRRRKDRR